MSVLLQNNNSHKNTYYLFLVLGRITELPVLHWPRLFSILLPIAMSSANGVTRPSRRRTYRLQINTPQAEFCHCDRSVTLRVNPLTDSNRGLSDFRQTVIELLQHCTLRCSLLLWDPCYRFTWQHFNCAFWLKLLPHDLRYGRCTLRMIVV